MRNSYGINGSNVPWNRHPAGPPMNSPGHFNLPPLVPHIRPPYNYPNNFQPNYSHMNSSPSWPPPQPSSYFHPNPCPPPPPLSDARVVGASVVRPQLAYIDQNRYSHPNMVLRPPQEHQFSSLRNNQMGFVSAANNARDIPGGINQHIQSVNSEQNVIAANNSNVTSRPSQRCMNPYRMGDQSNSSKHFSNSQGKLAGNVPIVHSNKQSLNSSSSSVTTQHSGASYQSSSHVSQFYPKQSVTDHMDSFDSSKNPNENGQHKNMEEFIAKSEKDFSSKIFSKDDAFIGSSSSCTIDKYDSCTSGKRLIKDDISHRSSSSLGICDKSIIEKKINDSNKSLTSSNKSLINNKSLTGSNKSLTSSNKSLTSSNKSLTASDLSLTNSSISKESLKSNYSESSSHSRHSEQSSLDSGIDHDSSRSYNHSKTKSHENDNCDKNSSRFQHPKAHRNYKPYGNKHSDRSDYYRPSERSNKYKYERENDSYEKKSSTMKDRSSEYSEGKYDTSRSMEKSSKAKRDDKQISRSDHSKKKEINIGRTYSTKGHAKYLKKRSPDATSSKNPILRLLKRSHSRDHSSSRSPTKYSRQRSPKSKSKSVKNKPSNIETFVYIKSSPDEMFYTCSPENSTLTATNKLDDLHLNFRQELADRAKNVCASKPKYEPPQRKMILRKPKPPKIYDEDDESLSSEDSSSGEEDTAMEELEKKKRHPHRLHPELWFNDPKEMNDGPLCRCSAKAGRSGIRHGIYIGEDKLPRCNPHTNNAQALYHYRITMTPQTNFMTKNPTTIAHDGHDFTFEGFSMFSHLKLPKLPNCKVIRFNYEYTILYIEEEFPDNFTIENLDLFSDFLFEEILELVDLNWKAHNDPDGCPRFHFMPRFTRNAGDDRKQLLPMNVVLQYLLDSNQPLVKEESLPQIMSYSQDKWQDLADDVKGMIVTCPSMKPSSLRVDQLDRERGDKDNEKTEDGFPVIVHFGVRPPQLSYAGNPAYQKAWRSYVKFRHLLANKPKVLYNDRHKLAKKEFKLQQMRMENDLKRDVTVVISSKGFYKTGIMSDIVQHAMLLPVLVCHLRFHQSLTVLEERIGYKFNDRFLLQLALTHPSYRENFGTNPDHARNSLTNCGLRQPQYGDRRIHYMNTRKRGINTLINIMSRFGSREETISSINHNERLEFLGDAVVEFLSSIHLFYMFPDLEEGGLATYRAAIVQNQHLAVLAKKLHLEKFMLYAHGSDLCHDLELRHAMANCFEALMGALFLDAGIKVADKVFSATLFTEPELLEVWQNYPPHPLQEQEPNGDRKWIALVPLLQKLNDFEKQIGIEFTHIRLLARSLTHRSIGFNNLTLGSNQRLEFLGDTVLQLVASEYLYKYFPEHHEGHLSLLRSSLVNNRTQAVVCGDLGMIQFAIYPLLKVELKTKDRADLLEAFLGALYVDKGLGYCRKFCEVCFFPRLQHFIMNQEWNDPKSKLQQCCLTLRSMDGGEPDIPTYKVIECKGPTNTRVYSVAVYFQGNRLAVGNGHSIQQAEMDAASNALRKSRGLFPQLRHQRRAIQRSLKQDPPSKKKVKKHAK